MGENRTATASAPMTTHTDAALLEAGGASVFITHPEVVIDPSVPVVSWSLSPHGRQRLMTLAGSGSLDHITAIVTSTETKAIESGELLALALGAPVSTASGLGETDRSSTGYLAAADHELGRQALFGQPEVSWRGWESATAAQQRIVAAVATVVERSTPGPLAIVGHGATGTFLRCHMAGIPITIDEDQPDQGHLFAFNRLTLMATTGWLRF